MGKSAMTYIPELGGGLVRCENHRLLVTSFFELIFQAPDLMELIPSIF